MIRGRDIWALAAGPALALFALASAAPAAAPGSVNSYRLPPGPTAAPPPVQGPVDPEAPAPRPIRPTPQQPEAPTSAGQPPRIVLPSPTPTGASSPAPQRRQQRASPTPEAVPAIAPTASEAAEAQPSVEASTAPPPLPASTPLAPPAATSPLPGWLWIALAALGTLAILAGAIWMLRRRGSDEGAAEQPAEAAEPVSAPEAGPPAVLPPTQRSPAVPPPATPLPRPEFPAADLDLQFEASQLSRSLVYATLAYRLTLTNRTTAALPPARILADLVSAHASLATEDQLSPGADTLQLKHEVPTLAPDEPVSLSGELRIPIATIRPIMRGRAALFVPLARFRVESADDKARDHVYVVGQPADQPGGALKPLRIDDLPGVVRPLDQRRIAANAA